jgi:hypothetical protein
VAGGHVQQASVRVRALTAAMSPGAALAEWPALGAFGLREPLARAAVVLARSSGRGAHAFESVVQGLLLVESGELESARFMLLPLFHHETSGWANVRSAADTVPVGRNPGEQARAR